MGRREAKHAYRVLCVKDDKVYYIQINKDGKISKHYFKNPISYQKYQQEKHLKPIRKEMLEQLKITTENNQPSQMINLNQEKPPNIQNLTQKTTILNSPNYETDRSYFFNIDDSDENEDQYEFDAEFFINSQSILEGSIDTYDPTALC